MPAFSSGGTEGEEGKEGAGWPGRVAGLSPEYALICTATDEMSTTGTLTDPTLRALLEGYGDAITRKLVLMIAWFNLLSPFLNGCRVPMEVTDKVGSKKFPLE